MAKTANQHVVPSGEGRWTVRSAGANRATKAFSTQVCAVNFARKIAKRNDSELFIHGRDGTIRDRESYGNDPCPPKDRK
ncbi:MAG TPA: hypothetical protein DCO75_00460 [Fibrobacteres bacterium]|jgi:hypothetical protein|nr:hypothetical protein [Fibrobacterota bacterium]